MLTIGIIDKYPVTQNGISVLLSHRFTDVVTIPADNTYDFARLNPDLQPNIIILGVNDDNISDSLSTVRECRHKFPSVSLIAYDQSYYQGSSSVYFKLGVKGHILKQCTANELVTCIENVLKGKHHLSAALHQILLEELVNNPIPAALAKEKSKLTLREREIAAYLCEGKGTFLIAKLLNRKPSTISTIKRNILDKMNLSNIIELARVFNKV